MKYYRNLFAFLCIMLANSAPAKELCVSNDTVAIVLDATVTPSSRNPDTCNYQTEWSVQTSYGKISGLPACLSAFKATIVDFVDGVRVMGGEQNGEHCFCGIKHPVISSFVYANSLGSLETCIKQCACNCSYVAKEQLNSRKKFFNSIEN